MKGSFAELDLLAKQRREIIKPRVLPKVEGFTPEQQLALQYALEGHNLCITGSAGTGKSYLLRHIIQQLRIRHGDKGVYVTASTGLASTHIDGTTLHSFAGVGVDFSDMDYILKRAKKLKSWREASVLIIDEMSMISPHFWTVLNTLGKRVRGVPQKPFGGIQVIVTGDFMQLPYIDKDYAEKRKKDPTLPSDPLPLFACKSWKDTIQKTVLLSIVHRQKDDLFINLLQHVRMGQLTDEDDALLRSRIGAVLPQDGIEPTRIHTHKADVESENNRKLKELPGPEYVYDSEDEGPNLNALKVLRNNCLAPTRLVLKVGAQVMLVKNLAPPELVNGSRGVVVGFKSVTAGQPEYPDVQFTNGSIINLGRQVWEAKKGDSIQASRSQVPLALAWALTVHKCQGMTLDKVQEDISRCFATGQAYTALSRCTSLEGITLIGYTRDCIKVDARAVEWYARLGDAQAQVKEEEMREAAERMEAEVEKKKSMESKKRGRNWWDEYQ